MKLKTQQLIIFLTLSQLAFVMSVVIFASAAFALECEYVVRMAKADWQTEGKKNYECTLWQKIPFYGEGRFTHQSGYEVRFDLYSDTPVMHLKHLHDLSDEQVVKGWTENPYWQYFCGEEYFQHKMPIHPTTMTKWRNRPGKSGSEKLLIETIKAGLKSKTIKPGSLKKVTVDTTVQEKNIACPTDSKLLNKARETAKNTSGRPVQDAP